MAETVTIPLTIRCPLCKADVAAGERHECTRGDGERCSIFIGSMELEVEAKPRRKRRTAR